MTLDRVERTRDGKFARVSPAQWNRELTSDETAALLGLKNSGSVNSISRVALPRETVEGRLMFRAADIATYLQGQRERWAPASIRGAVKQAGGEWQTVSQSLCACFLDDGHKTRTVRDCYLVDVIRESQVNGFLSSRQFRATSGGKERVSVAQSAFDRFNLREKDGSVIEMTTHEFRHWVTTKAAAAGVEDALIARWQNREHAGDLSTYKHLTATERLSLLKSSLKGGKLGGTVAQMYFSLADDLRDVWLENHVQAVHVTPYGLCVHNFSVAPCPKAVNCLNDCPEYIHDTENPEQRLQLLQLQRRTSECLTQARDAVAMGDGECAESWVAVHETTLVNVGRILSATPSPGTSLVRPFEGAPQIFNPVS